MQGICKLCNKEGTLKESHFIPKFIGKWIKKTSITGFLRENNDIHKRKQDIAKEYWLCGECEGLFSNWERQFANNIFHPFVDDNKSKASYENWMPKFCASISWRTLTYIRSKNPELKGSDEDYKLLDAAESHLAKYLLGENKYLEHYKQHVFPLEEIESTTQAGLPPNINRYFLRVMAMDIINNSENIYIYTKLPRFIILGVVKSSESQDMRSSQIREKSGKIKPRDYWWPEGFISYIVEKTEEISAKSKAITEKDGKKFEEFILKNPDKAANSKQFEAFIHDYEMFGDDVFR
ncbi:hypothetical protein [Psychromonas sp. SP041]|uniref:hypothetical protein n=1 Tax=Psychromonas sp. SP041 TaxID=1365007 RepID=UPI0004268AA3|nr:hypothetical protein [Psychromonas sp. SP041]